MDTHQAAQMLANRLKKNEKHLAKWRKREHVSCYRVYDADIPEFAFAIDIYQDIHDVRWVHAQEYEPPKKIDSAKAQARLDIALTTIKNTLKVDDEHLFSKTRRRQKGLHQYEKIAAKKDFIQVQESDLLFWVNFSDYLDTGLFLDHRTTRNFLTQLMHQQSGEKSFLNLFAYTGSATVYAAKGGALKTTTVDMSNTYLDWAKRNMSSNGYKGINHQFIQSDCLQWLAQPHAQKYDLIFLDPPSFSTSKRMKQTFDVQKDHVEIIRYASQLLKENGILIFSNNLRSFKMDTDKLPHLKIENISRQTLTKDFERNPKIHNCWKIKKR